MLADEKTRKSLQDLFRGRLHLERKAEGPAMASFIAFPMPHLLQCAAAAANPHIVRSQGPCRVERVFSAIGACSGMSTTINSIIRFE
jgi:hypothetical protein